MALFYLFFWWLGIGNHISNFETEKVRKPRSGKWTVLRTLRFDGNCDDDWLTGTSWDLAVHLCSGICDSSRMGQRSSDRKSIQGEMVGLFKHQMESGRIHLSSGFTVLGCARLSGSEMVQWDHVDFITYFAEASDAYCAADTDRCTFCGYLWFLYAPYRKE